MPSTALEQYSLELLNETRLDPFGAAARYIASFAPLAGTTKDITSHLSYFGVVGATLLEQLRALNPAQPLAFNDKLATAAERHSAEMIKADQQSHQLPGEADLGTRLKDAGYRFTSGGENVYAYSYDALFAHAGFMVDWGRGPDGIQAGAGHRVNIMNAGFREVGIDMTAESDPKSAVGPFVVTQNFGSQGTSGAFVLGVAYLDADRNDFYSVGEGAAGLNVSLAGASATSGDSGGYALQTFAKGLQTVTLTGGGLSGSVKVEIDVRDGLNAKLDIVDGTSLRTSVSGTISGAVTTIEALGVKGLTIKTDNASRTVIGTAGDDTITTGAGNDRVRPGGGSDRIDAGLGEDTAIFDFAAAAASITQNGSTTIVEGPGGRAVLTGFEHFVFTDKEVAVASTSDPVGATVAAATGPSAGSPAAEKLSAVYRFYDTKTGDHFYTTSADEKASILKALPHYLYEGVAWATPEKGTLTVDVYRFYDTVDHGHFYTTSAGERDFVRSTLKNYTYEGVAFQAFSTAAADPDAVTLDRFYNTDKKVHHYSASAGETAWIKAGHAGAGWHGEGPGFVVHAPTPEMLLL
jgi:hypothetical protein